jgi:hypothetical protein
LSGRPAHLCSQKRLQEPFSFGKDAVFGEHGSYEVPAILPFSAEVAMNRTPILPALLGAVLFAAAATPALSDPGECVPGRAVVDWSFPWADRIQDYLEGKATLRGVFDGPEVEQVFAKYSVGRMSRLRADVDLAIRNRGLLSVREAYETYEAKVRAAHPLRQMRAPAGVAHVPTYGIYVLTFDPAHAPAIVCRALEATGRALWAEPDRVVRATMTPNDPRWNNLWGTQQIGCATAWDTATGSGAVAAVIDTGVAFTHEDLSAQSWANPNETTNGSDDDGNGLVDDIVGWDYVNSDNNPADDHGHGTHCAGTVAAAGNNNRGIIGVAFGAKIMALKGMGSSGSGSDTDLDNCINYARVKGADVMSCSWGEAGWSSLHNASIQNALANGVVPVFAAGNDNHDGTLHTPTNCPYAFSVAASTSLDGRATFSNFGVKIDVTAPGVSILSCQHSSTTGYVNMQGTSMACPHVAGAMTVLVSELTARGLTTVTVEQMRQILRLQAADTEAAGWDQREGYGRLDVGSMMGFDAARAAEAHLTSPNGGSPVTGNSLAIQGSAWAPTGRFQDWTLEYASGHPYDSDSWTAITTSTSTVQGGTLHTWDISGLADGRYTIRLTVRNDQNTAFRDRVDFVRDALSDDSSGSATPVVGGSSTYRVTFDRNLNTTSDQDWFSMTCVQGVAYQFRTTMLSGKTDTVITLYQSDGTTQVATNDDYPNPGDKESLIAWTCSSSGTYYLKIVGFSDGSYPTPDVGSYRIGFWGLFPDGAEPDGDAAHASTLTVNGDPAQKSIAPAGDDDWAQFQGTSGKTYTVEASKVSTAAATTLELIGTDGSTVLQTGTSQTEGHLAVSSWTCPANGTYYVRVRSASNSCGHYTVRVFEKKDVLYHETFEVVGAALWTPTTPADWTVSSNAYSCTNTAAAGHFSHAGPAGWGSLTADAKIRIAAGGDASANDGVLLWGDDNSYVMARIRRDDLLEIVQMENGTQALMASVARTVNDDTDYRLRVVFEGGHAVISVDGTVAACVPSRRFPTGRLGLRSFGATGSFDDLDLWRPGPGTLVDFALATTALPPGMQGRPYSQPILATGGTTPYAFAALGSTAPPGLSLSAAGVLSGTPTAAGTYSIQVSVLDAGLRLRAGVVTLTILAPTTGDTSPPTIAFVNPTDSQEIGTDDEVLQVDVTDPSAVSAVRVRINGGSWSSLVWQGSDRWELPIDLAEGSNAIEVEADDYVPNTGSSSITVDLDTTPPELTIGTWTDGEISFHSGITLDGGSTDAASITVNGSPATSFNAGTGAWTSAQTLAVYGENTFTIRATDSLGRYVESVVKIRYRLKGDVDGDQDVDEDDVLLTARIESGEHTPDALATAAADADDDGKIDLKDAYAIRRVASGEQTFP